MFSKPQPHARGRVLAGLTMLAPLIVMQPWPSSESAIADVSTPQGRENTRLPACVATTPDSGWTTIEVGTVATVRLPPDARSTPGTGPAEKYLTPNQRRALS